MKILVSDYDDTFYINDDDIKNNVNLINEFMKNNIFIMATGRSYLDFKKKKELYNINYNYLILNHGATIIHNNNVIYNIEISNSIKEDLIKDLKIDTTLEYFACSKIESRVSLNEDNLTKIHVKYKTVEDTNQIKKLIETKYSEYINCFYVTKNQAIEIVSKDVDKSNAISFIADLEKIDKENIYTIGDSYTDIEMIKKFNGYRMKKCVEELKLITDKKYESVSVLIEEILNNKI